MALQTLMLINPSKRPSKRKSGASKMARKKRTVRRAVAAKPARRTYRKASPKVVHHYTSNPAPRRKSRARRAVGSAVANVKRRVKRYRSNPSPRGIMSMVKPALQGVAGSLLVNTAVNYLPLPDSMKTGNMLHVTRVAGALAVGLLAHKMIGKEAAKNMAQGAMIVTIHDAVVGLLSGSGLKLGGVDVGTDNGLDMPWGNSAFGGVLTNIGTDNSMGAYTTLAGYDASSLSTTGMGEYVDLGGSRW